MKYDITVICTICILVTCFNAILMTWCKRAIITSYWLGAEGHARPEQQSLTEKVSFVL